MAQNQEKAEDFAQWLGDRWSVADQSSSNQQNAVRRVSANQNREEDYYEGGGVGETKMLKSRARQILISEELSSSPKSFENDDDGIIHPYRKKSHNKESYYFQKNQGVGARMKKGFRSGTDAVGGGVGSVGGVGTKRIGGGGGEKTVEMESLVRTRSSSDSSSFSYGSKSSSNERITKSDHQGKKRFSSSSNNNTRNDGKNRDNQKRNTATNKMKKRKDKKGIKEEEEEEEGRTGEQEAYDYDEFEISRINVLISHD
ncbi:expressed protein [Phakopsora pachyrhizi]|uniref:Expressed protein n=1 Tax=Phakopsora pachyrhizi TaxID=170000 RepID=A0AAV0BED7_PHAPC|nr:expressed protein [Phakopsora pachyrhizi]